MTALNHQQREKLRDQLITFLKTLPKLAANNQWSTFLIRMENCQKIFHEIQEMEGETGQGRVARGSAGCG